MNFWYYVKVWYVHMPDKKGLAVEDATAHLPIDVGDGSQVNFFLKFEQVHVVK